MSELLPAGLSKVRGDKGIGQADFRGRFLAGVVHDHFLPTQEVCKKMHIRKSDVAV